MNENIKKIIEGILNRLTMPFDSIEEVDGETGLVFMIKTDEAPVLIGVNGANLIALSHIVKRITEKEIGENSGIKFTVDVNNYQEDRNKEVIWGAC